MRSLTTVVSVNVNYTDLWRAAPVHRITSELISVHVLRKPNRREAGSIGN